MSLSIHSVRHVQLRNCLKKLRLDAGLTQVQLAQKMGLEQSQISKLERAVKFVDVWLFVDYVTACGFAPAYAIKLLTAMSTDIDDNAH
jgi:transcriptional regulator with XRE-family HTH domain|nr:helix-turn-helix transcriptional regulator [uncultured Limnohabitans sp.]